MVSTPAARTFTADVVAALAVAGLLLPEAIAYAGIAGLAPVHALVASIAGLLAYGLVGGSRFALVAPTSASATILAAAIATVSRATPGEASAPVAIGAGLVLLTGTWFLIAALARVGHLAAFISRPVLRGFAFGLAVTIVARQLPHVVGVAAPDTNPIVLVAALLLRFAEWNPWCVALGAAAYVGLRALRRFPSFPGAFCVIVAGMALGTGVDLGAHGIPTVGALGLDHVRWGVPHLDRDTWLQIAQLAMPLVVILYAESWGSIRTLALRHGDAVDANRELAGLGFANLLSGLFQGLPVGAGFSASSANEDAGARTRAAGLVAAGFIVILLTVASRPLANLPVPVLAAVVVSALTHALDPRPLLALWRLGRDELLAVTAVLAVIVLGVVNGMLLAVLLSIVAAVRSFSQAPVSVLGELGRTRDFVDLARHPEAAEAAGVLVVRPEAPLFFANAERTLFAVRGLAQARPSSTTVVVSLEESADLDSTALEALLELDTWMQRSGRRLVLARAKDGVRELLQRAQPMAASPLACFWSVADAVDAARPAC